MNNHAKNNQSGEDYLESILTISRQQEVVHRIDVAKRMDVSQAAVNKAVKILCEKGWFFGKRGYSPIYIIVSYIGYFFNVFSPGSETCPLSN